MNRVLLVILVTSLLAGCLEEGNGQAPLESGTTSSAQAATGALRLTIFDGNGNLVPDVQGTLGEQILEIANGKLDLELPVGEYTLALAADDYLPFQESFGVKPDAISEIQAVLSLAPQPYQEVFPFEGYIDCAVDAVIIPGPCDLLFDEYVPGWPDLVTQDDAFLVPVEDGWVEVVVDVIPQELEPTMPAIRLAGYLESGEDQLLQYERFIRASGSEPFQILFTPGGEYGEEAAAPVGASTLQFQIFPEGYGYQSCVGEACSPFTGVGAASRVDVTIFVSVFYLEGAPEGYTAA